MSQQLVRIQSSTAQLNYEIAQDELARLQQVHAELIALGQVDAAAANEIAQAESSLQLAGRLLAERDYKTAGQTTQSAARNIDAARRAYRKRAVHGFSSLVSSPWCVNFDTLPLHWRLAQALHRADWGPNQLAAGDFEDLQHMKTAGWRQHRSTPPDVDAAAEISLESPRAGRSCLRIYSWPTSSLRNSPALDTPPIWIASPPMPVRRGQLARINGWVKVRSAANASAERLLIFDSLGGLPLAQHVEPTGEWTPFTLYRAIDRDGEIDIGFALQGLGEAWLDDVSVQIVNLPAVPHFSAALPARANAAR